MAGLFTNTVWQLLRVAVLMAVYRNRGSIGGFDVVDAITFSWLAEFLAVAVMYGAHLPLADRIRSGEVVVDLYRPRNVQVWCLAQEVGRALFMASTRTIPPLVAAGLIFDLRFPTSPTVWAVFLVSTALALVVNYGHKFLVSLSTFWLLDYRGTAQMATVLMLFFSGFIVPIVLFPPWLEQIARWLPYPAMLQVPIEVLLGKYPSPGQLGAALAGQALWAAGLLLAGHAVLDAAHRKVVVQGG